MRHVSTIPSVLAEIVRIAEVSLENVAVSDGAPVPPMETTPDIVCIGFTGDPDDEAITTDRERNQLSNMPDMESYDITCLSSSWRGHEKSMSDVRQRAFDMIDILNAAFAADATLGGLAMRVRISSDAVIQDQTDKGAVCTVRFVIRVEAVTR
jgi:hypothetical protein